MCLYLHICPFMYTIMVSLSSKKMCNAMNYFKKILSVTFIFWSGLTFSAELSLKDKIGQMLIIGFDGKTITANSPVAKAIENHNIGGVILFDYNAQTMQFNKNIESPAQVDTLNRALQQANEKANSAHHRDNLPLLISVDYEGGKVNRLNEKYGFPATPSAKTIAQMSAEDARKIMGTMAETLKSSGFNLDFAPVLDVDVNPDNPVIGKLERSFSDDPDTVADYGYLFSQQLMAKQVLCAYKHFPGHGSSTADSHLGFVDVTDTWHEQELLPYQQLLEESDHCGMIMTAHIVNRKLDASGLPATLSHTILTDVLRHDLAFDGVIITDDMQMKAISANYSLDQALTLAINAGADMFIFGNQLVDSPQDPGEIINIIEKKVINGEIAEERINDAYKHIMAFKRKIPTPKTVS